MSIKTRRRLEKNLLLALKVAVGSAAAIYIAGLLQLEYAVSAGTVTLLSLLGTKMETVKFTFVRLGTFAVTTLLAVLFIPHMESVWVAFGMVIFGIVFLSAMLDWKSTLSVNGVIAAHYMTTKDFGIGFLYNEFMLVLIGVSIAFLLNMFYLNKKQEKHIIKGMRFTEKSLQDILCKIADYLMEEQEGRNVWEDIRDLESRLADMIEEAREYKSNSFMSYHQYYIDYFIMRMNQLKMLHSLHYEMQKIRSMPRQAKIVADYMRDMAERISEKNTAENEMKNLQRVFENMRKEELPKEQEEFESRALLYHIMMDMEEFLKCKIRFVEHISEKQKKMYW